jgi:ribosomal protein S18 acetylase RimI-like enzyme
MTYKIRDANPADAATIAEFNNCIARETENRSLEPGVIQPGVATILSDSTKGRYWVAERDGEIVGQIMVTYEWSDWRNGTFWWIQSVYVAADHRGKGVFRTLMSQIEAKAKDDPDCCGLRLYVHHENESALHTYRKLGFQKLDYEVYEACAKYPH